MSYPTAIHNLYNTYVTTIDIREDSLAKVKDNYLEMKLKYSPNIIITNPPFNHAVDIINKALEDVEDNGYVIMLLRLNFFGSIDRFEFFQKQLPKYCFVHHKRIGFTDKKDKDTGKLIFDKDGNTKKGSTDSIEYCHMVWKKGEYPEFTQLKVI
jgi:sugar-specific transcriptional regulator TrmB